MEHEGVSFRRALKDLEIETSDGSLDMDEMQFRFYDDPPCKEWQSAAGDFIARAERYLWHPNSPESQKALE